MTKSKQPMSGTKARSGGGAMMNKNVKVTTTHGSPNTRKVSPSAVSNIGLSKGNHGTDGRTMQRKDPPLYKPVKDFVRMGNDVAKDGGEGGLGAGRVSSPTGSQMQHAPPNRGEAGVEPLLPGG